MKGASAPLLALMLGCPAANGPTPVMVDTQPSELDHHLTLALQLSGRDADRAAYAESLDWLKAHAEEAQAVLLPRLSDEGSVAHAPRIAVLLGELGRPEAVPALAPLLESDDELLAEAAGRGLAKHPAPAARAALLTALEANDASTVVVAADGLGVRRDPTVCAALGARADHPDRTARYHVLQAAGRLGCLSAADLERLRSDADPDIRFLAGQIIEAQD